MTLAARKAAFAELGRFLSQFHESGSNLNPDVAYSDIFFDDFLQLIQLSQSHNRWFTPEQVYFAIESWAEALTPESLDKWLQAYDIENVEPKTVGLVLAGNIPLVGFHDFLSVLITGHRVLIKTSSNDQHLLPFLIKYLVTVEPEMGAYIDYAEGKLEGFDAVIATGSNNTARYFEYYFKDKPAIIRKNRNSVAVLTGDETPDDLEALGEDIFRYFGLGCRNVSKLFVPEGYDFTKFFEAMYKYKDVIAYEKYANNYDYNKAVFLMSNFKILDNGFITIKEDNGYASPISSVFYEFYNDKAALAERLQNDADQLQCIVGTAGIEGELDFGKAQHPQLWDYADDVDTISFLLKI